MRSAFSHIRIVLTLMLFGLMLLSCQKERPYRAQSLPEPERHDVVNAWLSLDLKVLSSGAETKAVADDVSGGTNNGIDENVIRHLVIWLVPVADGTEDWSEAIMTYVPQVALVSGDRYLASVLTKLNVPMNVYVGANISADIASAFLAGGPDAVYESLSEDYPDLAGEFASADNGVAMFCTRKASLIFIEANADKTTPAIIDVELVRMLAKVHLLFQCYDAPYDGFVKITEPGSMTPAAFGAFGWSRMDDISYIVNGVNRSTRILGYPVSPYADYEDLNHSMSDMLEKSLEWDYKAGMAEELLFFAEDLTGDHDAAWTKWSAKPERYAENKAPFGTCTDGQYVNGLYCLENTTDNSAVAFMTADEKKYVPFMVATHVIVKARFVPRIINTVRDGMFAAVDHGEDGYDSALSALSEVTGVDENGNPHTYPAGTFFTRDMKEFYDYAGMLKLIELGTVPGLARKNFATYPGGYGFYYSYIYGGTDGTTGQVTFDGENSGVFRNHYHILNCRLMKVPATPGSFNQLMMVNSKVVDWNPKGSLNMIVKPNV